MTYVIAVHALLGTLALVLGLVALAAPKRRGRHTRAGEWYFPVMLALLATGFVIGTRDPAISPFEVAILPTLGPLLMGWQAVRRRRGFRGSPWIAVHIGGMGGSFIGLVTAGLFQTGFRLLPDTTLAVAATFALPSIVGTLLIARTIERRIGAAPRTA